MPSTPPQTGVTVGNIVGKGASVSRVSRTVVLQRLPLLAPDRFLRVSVSYDMGGMNFMSGSESPRGYYLSARVVEQTAGLEIYGMFSGCRKLLEPAARFSRTRLSEIGESAMSSPHLPPMVAKVLAQAGTSLTP
jgi:hypothetical protein